MWLPTDERRLLARYYVHFREVGTVKRYRVSDLRPWLKYCHRGSNVREYGESGESSSGDSGDVNTERWMKEYSDEIDRIERANKHLAERGLIELARHEHERDVILLKLTINGYDPGLRYAGWFTRSGLWFQEYRNHWLWLIFAFIGGAFCIRAIEFVASLLTRNGSGG